MRFTSAIVGGILYYVIISLVLRMGLKADDLKLLTAIVVAIFLGIPFWKKSIMDSRIKKGVESNVKNQ